LTREGANNPVTLGDTLSHRAMTAAVVAAFPGISVISEEDEDDDGRANANSVETPPKSNAEVNFGFTHHLSDIFYIYPIHHIYFH